jgi:hypothetical protein
VIVRRRGSSPAAARWTRRDSRSRGIARLSLHSA